MLARTTAVLYVLVVTTGCAEPQPPANPCRTVDDCPPTNNPCLESLCNFGACTAVPLAMGTPISEQVAGDCRKIECDGEGQSFAAVDDSDLPLDSSSCTMDACNGGIPLNAPLAVGTACSESGGSVCNAGGSCVECNVATDCAGEDTTCAFRVCESGTCSVGYAAMSTPVESQMAGDCRVNVCDGSGGTTSIVDDTDLLNDGNDCTADTCVNGTPQNSALPVDSACNQNGGSVCDASGSCVECNGGTQCASGICMGGACQAPTCTDGLTNGTESDVDCGGGNCPLCTIGDACTSASDCTGGNCQALSCAPPVVNATTPSDGTMNVPVNSNIAVVFSGAMIPASLVAQTTPGSCMGSIQVSTDDFASCLGFSSASPTMSANDTIATLTPSPALSYGSKYFIRATTAAKGIEGLSISAPYTSAMGFMTVTPSSETCSGSVVISEIYGGGGGTGAPYENDFVELHNRGTSMVNLSGWSVQYAGAAGTTWLVTNLSGSIAPGGYYLVQGGSSGTTGILLPSADATGMTNMSATAGKVALVKTTTALTGGCPTSANIVDFVGYGTANCDEGAAPAPAGSNTESVSRLDFGCVDTDNNDADFSAGSVSPKNTPSAPYACACSTLFGTMNESGLPAEIDLCSIQGPSSITVAALSTTPMIYGRVLETGITEAAGANPAVVVEIGYGPTNTNPTTQSGWTFFPTTYSTQQAAADEYEGSFTAPMTSGSYRVAVRASLDGNTWTYCDLNGAGSSAGAIFEITQLPTLEVTP